MRAKRRCHEPFLFELRHSCCTFACAVGRRVHDNCTPAGHSWSFFDKMSRQSMAPNRNLSLTEELEKLEQSITLTLQGKQTLKCPHQHN